MINDWYKILRLGGTSHTQSYFYIKYRKHIKNFKSNINSDGKIYFTVKISLKLATWIFWNLAKNITKKMPYSIKSE